MVGLSSVLFKARLNWAVPSFVIPGDIAANVHFLAGKTPGISLCFFEARACLAYTATDLPSWLQRLNCSWHLHLPLNLPWGLGVREVAKICQELWDKAAFLKPVLCVLHPPNQSDKWDLLTALTQYWHFPAPVALENVAYCDLLEADANFFANNGYSICLDVGHALGYVQTKLLASRLVEQAIIWHWSAPGKADQHLPLSQLTPEQTTQAQDLFARANPDAIHLLEIFNWQGIGESIKVLERFSGQKAVF